PRSSYFYHRTRMTLEDKYFPLRRIMTDLLRTQSPLLRLSPAHSFSDTALHLNIRESRAAFNETGSFDCPEDTASALQFLFGRDKSGTGKPSQPRLSGGRPEREMAD